MKHALMEKNKVRGFRNWFKIRKQKREDPCHPCETSDGDLGDESYNSYMDELLVRSVEISSSSCNSSNELRIFVGTWNVAGRSPTGSLVVDLDDWLNLKDAADLYVLGFQELVPLKTRAVIGVEDTSKATKWNLLIGKTLNDKYGCPWITPMMNTSSGDDYIGFTNPERTPTRITTPSTISTTSPPPKLMGGSRYVLLASKKMVGVFISVWMKKEMVRKHYISNVKVSSVACGIMGCLGNKGSVSVSMSIEGTSFCFVTAHLASGEKKGDEKKRNYQVCDIFRRTSFSSSCKVDVDDPRPLTILGHDRIFWFGDLNYRLYLEDNLARELIKQKDWGALQEFDQLRREQLEDGVFQGWKEGLIEFAPTYKYSTVNGNRYSGGSVKVTGEKQRTPAWCDRILWYGKGVKPISYFRSESKFSDHRPVSALFSTHIELLKSTNPRVSALSRAQYPTTPTRDKMKGDTTPSRLRSLDVLSPKHDFQNYRTER